MVLTQRISERAVFYGLVHLECFTGWHAPLLHSRVFTSWHTSQPRCFSISHVYALCIIFAELRVRGWLCRRFLNSIFGNVCQELF